MSIEQKLAMLLSYEEVLTISKTDGGFMITFSDVEVEGSDIYFIPSVVLTTQASLSEAISAFDSYQSMQRVSGYQA